MLYELRNLKKQFGDRVVLDIDALSMDNRKVYALIGPNGAGKTTLLSQLAFLDQPTSGSLRFHDRDVFYDQGSLVLLRKRVVLLDQNPILFSGTVWKNVAFGLKIRGVTKKECSIKIPAALERVGMSRFAGSDIHGLSGGEVKRVALARALVLEPEVLLCDEPTANVDQENQEVILKILAHTNSVKNTSVIFSTHYLSQSRRLAHHTILLQNGKVSHENNENTFDVLVSDIRPGGKLLSITGKDNLLLGEVAHQDLPVGRCRVHLNPFKIMLHPQKSGQSGDVLHQLGIVKNIRAEQNNIRLVVDMGVELNVLMSISRYRENPPVAGQRVKVEITRKAIVVL